MFVVLYTFYVVSLLFIVVVVVSFVVGLLSMYLW